MKGSAPLIVAASCLYGSILTGSAWLTRNGPTTAPDSARYTELRNLFRAGGLVGYISDAAPKDQGYRYIHAQNNLAPRILLRGVDAPQVVVDCANPAAAKELLARFGLRPKYDFGNGIVLADKPSQ